MRRRSESETERIKKEKQIGKLWRDVARFEDVLGLLLDDSDFFMRTRRLESETNKEEFNDNVGSGGARYFQFATTVLVD